MSEKYFENYFKVVGIYDKEEVIEIGGVAIDYGDGSEEIYFFHPLTGQRVDEARKLLQGWKPQDPEVESLWYDFIEKLEELEPEWFFQYDGENDEVIVIELEGEERTNNISINRGNDM